MSREIDALVAKHIFGLEVVIHSMDSLPPILSYQISDGGPLKPYSNDISAAWEVVQKMKRFPIVICQSGNWSKATFGIDGDSISGEHESAPMAICLAALKAKGIDIPE